jgi:argininosuccinate lyase
LHTARSRNDQVATDFRLWVRNAIDLMDHKLEKLQGVLIDRAEEHKETILPGFTHLQTAQPISLGHHFLAYVEMLGRDRSRFNDARTRMNESPLGAGALAGTSFDIDRDYTSQSLGFDSPMVNSLDAVSDRDFALEFLSNSSILAIHLSRAAEELVIWNSAQFHFITFSDKFSSGSSMMPQKRNPDAAELVRGKTGRVIGSLTALLITIKGLPMAYAKDLQEDKEPVFDAFDTLELCLDASIGMFNDIIINKESMRSSAEQGFTTATDLADWLTYKKDVPFREAHHIVGKLIQLCENSNCKLTELPLSEFLGVDPRLTRECMESITVEASLNSRTSLGGTAPANVAKAILAARSRYLRGQK